MNLITICSNCKFEISNDMVYALKNGICPKCGNKVEVGDLVYISTFVKCINKLNLCNAILTPEKLYELIIEFFKNEGNMSLPEFKLVADKQDIQQITSQMQMQSIPTIQQQIPTMNQPIQMFQQPIPTIQQPIPTIQQPIPTIQQPINPSTPIFQQSIPNVAIQNTTIPSQQIKSTDIPLPKSQNTKKENMNDIIANKTISPVSILNSNSLPIDMKPLNSIPVVEPEKNNTLIFTTEKE